MSAEAITLEEFLANDYESVVIVFRLDIVFDSLLIDLVSVASEKNVSCNLVS